MIVLIIAALIIFFIWIILLSTAVRNLSGRVMVLEDTLLKNGMIQKKLPDMD